MDEDRQTSLLATFVMMLFVARSSEWLALVVKRYYELVERVNRSHVNRLLAIVFCVYVLTVLTLYNLVDGQTKTSGLMWSVVKWSAILGVVPRLMFYVRLAVNLAGSQFKDKFLANMCNPRLSRVNLNTGITGIVKWVFGMVGRVTSVVREFLIVPVFGFLDTIENSVDEDGSQFLMTVGSIVLVMEPVVASMIFFIMVMRTNLVCTLISYFCSPKIGETVLLGIRVSPQSVRVLAAMYLGGGQVGLIAYLLVWFVSSYHFAETIILSVVDKYTTDTKGSVQLAGDEDGNDSDNATENYYMGDVTPESTTTAAPSTSSDSTPDTQTISNASEIPVIPKTDEVTNSAEDVGMPENCGNVEKSKDD